MTIQKQFLTLLEIMKSKIGNFFKRQSLTLSTFIKRNQEFENI